MKQDLMGLSQSRTQHYSYESTTHPWASQGHNTIPTRAQQQQLTLEPVGDSILVNNAALLQIVEVRGTHGG